MASASSVTSTPKCLQTFRSRRVTFSPAQPPRLWWERVLSALNTCPTRVLHIASYYPEWPPTPISQGAREGRGRAVSKQGRHFEAVAAAYGLFLGAEEGVGGEHEACGGERKHRRREAVGRARGTRRSQVQTDCCADTDGSSPACCHTFCFYQCFCVWLHEYTRLGRHFLIVLADVI